MRFTLACFHAHPDDEALFTAGTMAKAAAEGHRVILIVATDGGEGLAAAELGHGDALAARRMAELQASAAALGVARVVHLGYADSGMTGPVPDDPPGSRRFLSVAVDEAAQRLAEVLREERVDVLTTYDANGGYGHRDHVRVHQVGALAAELANTPRVLEATIPRDLLSTMADLVGTVYRYPPDFDPTSFRRAFSPRSAITHTIDVGAYAGAKRAAMAAHASQATADGGADRTLAAFLRLPRPVFGMVFGREWFVQSRGPVVTPGPPLGWWLLPAPQRRAAAFAEPVWRRSPGGRWWPRHAGDRADVFAGLTPRA